MSNLSELLLKTTFSCMACDGHIDNRETALVKKMEKEESYFGVEDLESSVNRLIETVNSKGDDFFSEYFDELNNTELSEDDEMNIAKAAVRIIEADEEVTYSEIRFFKMIRSHLSITDKQILDELPGRESLLEKDILTNEYKGNTQSDFFRDYSELNFQQININPDLEK